MSIDDDAIISTSLLLHNPRSSRSYTFMIGKHGSPIFYVCSQEYLRCLLLSNKIRKCVFFPCIDVHSLEPGTVAAGASKLFCSECAVVFVRLSKCLIGRKNFADSQRKPRLRGQGLREQNSTRTTSLVALLVPIKKEHCLCQINFPMCRCPQLARDRQFLCRYRGS